MTLGRGQDWGTTVPLPAGAVRIATDADLAACWPAGSTGVDGPALHLTGGDLLASLGGPSHGADVRRLPIDVVRVDADGTSLAAVAHVVARRRSWWRGPVLVVANADRLGRWDVAPRAHPGDGALDVVEVAATMGVRARWQAWRRLASGTHVPHPRIATSRVTERRWEFDPPRRVWVDGVDHGPVRSLGVAIEPDAITIHA